MDDRKDDVGGNGRYGGPSPNALIPQAPIKTRRKPRRQAPQETVQRFWDRMNSKNPGKVFSVLPDNPYARKKAAKMPHGTVHGQRAAKSYEEARAECVRDVDRIIKECRRLNQKYRDLHFDIEWDLKSRQRNCLDGLSIPGDAMKPKGVKRVTDIFEKPQFYVNGPTAGDVRQGRDGDCYLMAALCGLGNMKGLIDKVCVKQDQDVGVYGFVFFRDGEWQHTIIDDNLYLRAPDYDEAQDERVVWDDISRVDSAEEYRKAHQTGSRALYFAQCSDENETWLPLLEKAYAKAHGDFASIEGGFTGEALEDLTGGVTTEVYSTDILDRDVFWRDELMHVGRSFLFGCATGFYSNWLNTSGVPREREGISEGHAYSIMDAKEVQGQRLLKLRNPWGKKEWTGRWSDGSSQWTAEWMQLLDHKFGNDGVFWISYDDFLKKYQHYDRTRIFGPEWSVTQCWTSLSVSWSAEYHSTRFSLTLEKKAPVVIVLAQLDDTYFGGLEGGYVFDLHFRLESDDKEDENDYIVRSNCNYGMARSVTTDIELEAGTYSVLMRITATRHPDEEPLEDVLPVYAATRREKLIQMGLSYDLAHAKGVVVESEAERQVRKAHAKVQKARDRQHLKEKMRAEAEKHWKKEKQRHQREKERRARNKQRRERKQQADAKPHDSSKQHNTSKPRDSSKQARVPDGQNLDQLGSAHMPGSEIPERENGLSNLGPVRSGQKASEILKIESFTGEDIVVERVPGGDGKATEPAVGLEALSKPQPTEDPAPMKVVEPLQDVIKAVDEESRPDVHQDTRTDATPTEIKAQTEDSVLVEEKPPTPSVQINGIDAVTDVKPLPNLPPLSKPEREYGLSDEQTFSLQRASARSFDRVVNGSRRNVQRSDTLDTTAAMIGIGAVAGDESVYGDDLQDIDVRGSSGNDSAVPDDADSDADSFPLFDWNSDLDMTSESSSSESSSSARRRPRHASHHRPMPRRRGGGGGGGRPGGGGASGSRLVSPPPGLNVIDKDDDDEGPEEPWNAVCVVGLRVYSTLGGEGVKLRVVRPAEHDESESDDADAEHGRQGAHDKRRTNGDGAGVAAETLAILDPDDISKGAVAVVPESTGVQVFFRGEGEENDKREPGREELKLATRPRRPGIHIPRH